MAAHIESEACLYTENDHSYLKYAFTNQAYILVANLRFGEQVSGWFLSCYTAQIT